MEKRRVKNKMKSKMVGAFAVVMIALMVAGISFAMWTETINISGYVNTGEVDVSWSVGDGYDSEPEAKDVSSISGTVSQDGNTLTVTVSNAYPCIDYILPIDVSNTGTIPVIISDIVVDEGNLPTGCTVEILPDPAPNKDPDIAMGSQIERNGAAYGLLHVHLTNDAVENGYYWFTVTVTVVQWNEYT
jgi:hypothetical protein